MPPTLPLLGKKAGRPLKGRKLGRESRRRRWTNGLRRGTTNPRGGNLVAMPEDLRLQGIKVQLRRREQTSSRWRNQCPDCAGEWQSWTFHTAERKGREAKRGSTEAGEEERRRGERGEGRRAGRTGEVYR
jgi:hypothetical protein